MVKTIELSRIRTIAQFRSLLKKIQNNSDQYLLEQEGKVIAALIPPANVEEVVNKDIEAATKEVRAKQALFAVMDRVQAKNLAFSEEEVEHDIMAAREEIRKVHG